MNNISIWPKSQILNMDTSSGSPSSSALDSPLSSATNSPVWPDPNSSPGSSENSSDLATSAMSDLQLSEDMVTWDDFMTALRALNDREGTLITPAEFQTVLSLVDHRYDIDMSAAAVLGLSPDPCSGVQTIQKTHQPAAFSEEKCRKELVLLNQRTQTKLSLEELHVILTLVNKRFETLITASDLLEWLHQTMKKSGRTKLDEARSNVEAALAFLGVAHSSEVSMSNVEAALAILDLKVTDAHIMYVLRRMDDE